ncbi:hypothetical protein AV530_018726 [Patagioenas fasciata monilis]|uniref:Uncharacterized protein n=1 Tax=Patagioenas fasciata monilis TaxID=372326 RepID=A0A1V4JJC8_PATFA|nr:hypothetical protein AV530_018726 [Patagioenas fasciata monilis]
MGTQCPLTLLTAQGTAGAVAWHEVIQVYAEISAEFSYSLLSKRYLIFMERINPYKSMQQTSLEEHLQPLD